VASHGEDATDAGRVDRLEREVLWWLAGLLDLELGHDERLRRHDAGDLLDDAEHVAILREVRRVLQHHDVRVDAVDLGAQHVGGILGPRRIPGRADGGIRGRVPRVRRWSGGWWGGGRRRGLLPCGLLGAAGRDHEQHRRREETHAHRYHVGARARWVALPR